MLCEVMIAEIALSFYENISTDYDIDYTFLDAYFLLLTSQCTTYNIQYMIS